MRFVLGIDIGGTNLVVGCVAEDGSTLRALASAPTQAEAGASDVVDRLVALAQECIARTKREVPGAEILGVGAGAPGPLCGLGQARDRDRIALGLCPRAMHCGAQPPGLRVQETSAASTGIRASSCPSGQRLTTMPSSVAAAR